MVDNSRPSTWWSVTGWNSEIAILEDNTQWPSFVAYVHGGREICPDTGKEHFQGAVQCRAQQRFGRIKQWLPTSHISAVYKNAEALKNYVMKKETASGIKQTVKNSKSFYSADEMCKMISKMYITNKPGTYLLEQAETDPNVIYWDLVCKVLEKEPELAGQLMNPSLRGFWNKTRFSWDKIVKTEISLKSVVEDVIVLSPPQGGSEHSITLRQTDTVCQCFKDECLECYENSIKPSSVNITEHGPLETLPEIIISEIEEGSQEASP